MNHGSNLGKEKLFIKLDNSECDAKKWDFIDRNFNILLICFVYRKDKILFIQSNTNSQFQFAAVLTLFSKLSHLMVLLS